MSIGVLTTGIVAVFLIDSLKVSLGVTNNLDIENSIRTITNRLSGDARDANSFVIYKTFFNNGHEINGSFRVPENGALRSNYRRQAGESGNFCLFVYNGGDPNALDLTPAPIERLVGYYLNNQGSNAVAEIRRFDVDVGMNRRNFSVEELIPKIESLASHSVVVQSARGLISGNLFYNLRGRSVIINSEIIYDLPNKTSGGTYNFTVSPRG